MKTENETLLEVFNLLTIALGYDDGPPRQQIEAAVKVAYEKLVSNGTLAPMASAVAGNHSTDPSIKEYFMTRPSGLIEAISPGEYRRLKRVVKVARNLRDTLSDGFVVCSRCGDQEPTNDLDHLSELDAALKAHDKQST